MGGSSGSTTPAAPVAPAPENLEQQTQDELQAQINLAPEELQQQEQYEPQYDALDLESANDSMFGVNGQPGLLDIMQKAYPQITSMTDAANTQTRTSDISDLQNLGPSANAAVSAANPVLGSLNSEAQSELALGGQLAPDEARSVDQASAEAMADRGLDNSNPGIFAQALNRTQYSDARLQQRQSFASGVANQMQQPIMQILGQQSSAPSVAQSDLGDAQSVTQPTNTMFGMTPAELSSYAENLNTNNYEAANNFAIDDANNNAAIAGANLSGQNSLLGAGIGAAGTIGSAALMAGITF